MQRIRWMDMPYKKVLRSNKMTSKLIEKDGGLLIL